MSNVSKSNVKKSPDTEGKNTGPTSTKEKLMTAALYLGLPVSIFVPFLIVRYKDALCQKMAFPDEDIAYSLSFSANNEYVGFIAAGLLLLYVALMGVRTLSKTYRSQLSMAKQQLKVAGLSAVVTTAAYVLAYRFSEWLHPPMSGCSDTGVLQRTADAKAVFGLGISPTLVAIMIAAYVLVPLASMLIVRRKLDASKWS